MLGPALEEETNRKYLRIHHFIQPITTFSPCRSCTWCIHMKFSTVFSNQFSQDLIMVLLFSDAFTKNSGFQVISIRARFSPLQDTACSICGKLNDFPLICSHKWSNGFHVSNTSCPCSCLTAVQLRHYSTPYILFFFYQIS